MAKEKKPNATERSEKYRRVEVATLDRGRRGKHHDLVQGILEELRAAPQDTALEIPLADVGEIGLANLRSAVHRASISAGIAIETLADERNFYVWKKATSSQEQPLGQRKHETGNASVHHGGASSGKSGA